jgi:hypothetical protein
MYVTISLNIRREEKEEEYRTVEKNMKINEEKKKNKTKKLGRMVTLQMDQKRLIPPRKTPRNNGYVNIKSLKYKRRRVRSTYEKNKKR